MEIKLTALDSDLWENYQGAYGTVNKEIGILMGSEDPLPTQEKLRRMDRTQKDDYQIAFDNLCEQISHQLSFYSAIYLAMPYMVKLLERKMAENDYTWQRTIISEVGVCLITDTFRNRRRNPAPSEIMRNYKASKKKFRRLAKKFYRQYRKEIKQLNFDPKSQLVTAMLAICGHRIFPFLLFLILSTAPESCSSVVVNIVMGLLSVRMLF